MGVAVPLLAAGRAAFGRQDDLGVLRRFVGIGDTRELRNLARERLGVQALHVAALALLDRAVDVDLDEVALAHALGITVVAEGVENVSVEDVIAAANIARSTFYTFFNSKRDLLTHIVEPVFTTGTATFNALGGLPPKAMMAGARSAGMYQYTRFSPSRWSNAFCIGCVCGESRSSQYA